VLDRSDVPSETDVCCVELEYSRLETAFTPVGSNRDVVGPVRFGLWAYQSRGYLLILKYLV